MSLHTFLHTFTQYTASTLAAAACVLFTASTAINSGFDQRLIGQSRKGIGMKQIYVIVLAISSLFDVSAVQATTYKFTVTCQNQPRHVETWETGAIDPGKEYLRVVSGTNNANCSISDFNPQNDSALPETRHSDAQGIIEGLPPVVVIRKIFGF